MIVCTICALVTLASTLSVRFISQRNLNQQRVVQFANHAVEELDKVLLPLQAGSEVLLPLIGLPCSVAHLPLRKQAAKLQTVRSIGLVQDGTLYCSSIFGYRNVPVVDILAELPAPQPLLRLTIDRALIKGSPVLIQWTPAAGSSNAGVMEMINIDLLTAMLLEPQLPQISSASLTVDIRYPATKDGEEMRNCSATMHTLQSENGHTRICHYGPSSWTPNVSIYKIYVKCRLWLEMYEAHLRTGNNIDYYLNHQV